MKSLNKHTKKKNVKNVITVQCLIIQTAGQKKNHFSLKISSYLIRVKKQIEPKQKKNRL